MERVTETKLSLEALRQMKSHGRTASPTLIGAIEQIVNRAIETHLDEPFYSEAAPFLDYLGNRMALDCEQALVFALFMEQSTDNRIQISDFARMVGCRTVRVISMMAAADELVKRRLIRRVRKEDCLFYSVPMAVVTAVKEDRLYEPEPIDHLTSEQLFDRMGQIFDEAEEDNSHLLEDLDELVEANLQLPFCQQTRAYDLNKVERLLFYVFCHRFVNLDDDLIGSHNWLEYFNRRVAFGLKSQLNADRLSLQTQGVIEPCNEEGMGDRRYYHLTARAKELLFGDLCLVEQ
jgi:ATPases of the AAA+ class